MNKRVLFISYHYPPDREIGGQRVAQFVKYLGEAEGQPHVLSVHEKYYQHTDATINYDQRVLEAATRTMVFPWFRDIYLNFSGLLKKRHQKTPPAIKEQAAPQTTTGTSEGFFSTCKRYIFSLFFWLPDDKLGWVFPASYKAIQLIRKNNIDVVFTTGPPHSTHLTGLIVKLITGKKWLVDLRDPWVRSQKSPAIRSKLSDNIEKWLEKKVVMKCDLLVSVTQEMTDLYNLRYPECNNSHFQTIYNGYDPEELISFHSVEKNQKITFTYTGELYLDRDPEIFLQAIAHLIKEGQIDQRELSIKLIGRCRYIGAKSVEQIVADLCIEEIVDFIDPVPRDVALLESARSHILILFAQNQPLQVPGKLYEYIGLGAHILGICEKGASQTILSEYSRAVIVEEQSLFCMKKNILAILANVQKDPPDIPVKSVLLQRFDRRNLTRKLYECL